MSGVKVCLVVMLTKLEEETESGKKRPKADQYWPEVDQENFLFPNSDLRVEQLPHRRHDCGSYLHRKFLLTRGGQSQTSGTIVHQVQCTAWPDHSVPDSPHLLLELVREADVLSPHTSSPVLVHCSAGVGRMGTFIAVHKLMRDIERQKHGTFLEVGRTVIEMRKCRMKMVQTAAQYVYIYKCLQQLYNDMEEDEEEDEDEGDYYGGGEYYSYNNSYYENDDIGRV